MELSTTEELFLEYLEESPSIAKAAAHAGVSRTHGYNLAKKLKDVIIDRARDKLAMSALKAANTTSDMLDADASTEKGELKLKAAEAVMNRVGLTNHTSVEVSVESENGLFILPGKAPVINPETS